MREWYISGIACLIDQYIHFKSLKEFKSLISRMTRRVNNFHALVIKLLDSAVTALFFFSHLEIR